MTATTEPTTLTAERADLLDSLGRHRFFLRFTARDLTDEQARSRTTPSVLTVGGLIKHVTATESAWAGFITDGASAPGGAGAPLRTPPHTRPQPLPPAPCFEPGATWTARRALLHIIAETAQHAGHAD